MTKLSVLAFITVIVLLSSLARHHTATAQSVGWTCLPSFGGCDESGSPLSTTTAVVGLPFEWFVLAKCNTAQWTVQSVELATGRLPPGLEFGNGYYPNEIIAGVPTRAGSFSFQILFRGISCPGANFLPYGDWTQSYTITVTGN